MSQKKKPVYRVFCHAQQFMKAAGEELAKNKASDALREQTEAFVAQCSGITDSLKVWLADLPDGDNGKSLALVAERARAHADT
eukprot:12567799-Alexandrium_andersonii.AAC.1